MNVEMTIVTGLWDIKRDSLTEGWSRPYNEHYLKKFEQLLDIPNNMIIFGDEELKDFVFKKRTNENTLFVVRSLEWFKNNEFFKQIQDIRKSPAWLNQAGWLAESTQARLELYNPLVMSKMFLLNDARILDKFKSQHLYWLDAGITNTVHPGYFTHDKVLKKITKQNDSFTFICFPYEADNEIHGFSFSEICKLANSKVNKVARGGFFGGPVDTIDTANRVYYELLRSTLNKELMGTEESIFTLMLYQYPETFKYAEIESNGLISTYFENVKNDKVVLKNEQTFNPNVLSKSKPFTDKSSLYVITYNSPNQFKTLIESMKEYDSGFLTKTKKYLLNNSLDKNTDKAYSELCAEHGFEEIKQNNLGICGGRQFIAEHFDKSDSDYMMFFEDDMFLYPHKGQICSCGFNRYVENLYTKIMKIVTKESLDFLKFSFTEFYGNNSTQWSWYNVPQVKRQEYWPNYSKLPRHGFDPNSPKTQFEYIGNVDGLSYAVGEVYYCNWPQVVSKEGNKKMFLTTTWDRPFEQTWMSYIFQQTKEQKIKPGILLLSPINHNRFEHYSGDERKES